MTRLFAALIGVDVLFAAVGAILIQLRTREPDFVLPPPGQDAAMSEALRADAAGACLQWWLLAMVVLTAVAGSWLLWAQLARPSTPREERRMTTTWLLMLGLALIVNLVLGHTVYATDVINSSWRYGLAVAILIVTPVCFFLTTALGVKNAMVPSVPLAHLVRR